MTKENESRYAFGPFVVDRAQRQLLRDGQPIALQPKAFDLLMILVEKRGAVVPKEELLERLWPDTFVDESNLTQTIYVLRKTLGTDAAGAEYVSTIPKRGYRFTPAFDEKTSITKRHWGLYAIVLAVLAAVGVFVAIRLLHSARPSFSAAAVQLLKVTRSGDVPNAAISSDGQSIAYVVDANGSRSLWLKRIGSSTSAQIISPAEVRYAGLTFGRDGGSIFFVRFGTNAPLSTSPQIAGAGGTLFRIATRGGTAKFVSDYVSSPVDVSPDGKRIAFVRGSETSPTTELVIANIDGSSEKVLAVRRRPAFLSNAGPAWSPDSSHIAIGATPAGSRRPIHVVEVDAHSGAERPFSTAEWLVAGRVAWPLRDMVLLVASDEESKPRQVWRVGRSGAPQRVTNDFNNYSQLSVSRDGSSVLTIQGERTSTLWTIDVGEDSTARQLTHGGSSIDGSMGVAFAGSGQIVYTSLGSDRIDLWRIGRSGTGATSLTDDVAIDRNPTVSPNGGDVVYESNRAGTFNLWRLTTGGKPVRLTNGEGEFTPRFSSDGKWIVYAATMRDRIALLKIPASGVAPVVAADSSGVGPVLSPDNRLLAFQIRGEGSESRQQVGIVPTDGRGPMRILTLPPTAFQLGPLMLRWTPDGKGIAFVDNRGGVSNLLVQMIDGGPPKRLTHFDADRIFAFDWSGDGKTLALSRGRITSDAVLIRASWRAKTE
jgi:DNA-binding winged helix-turn-helix (wHTH) protein/Tol biopolymer transport system component